VITEEDFRRFTEFKVAAMGARLREIIDGPAYDSMTFEEKVKELIDAETTARQSRRIAKLNREARFKVPGACVEDIVYLPERKLSKDRVNRYAECEWIKNNEVTVVISKSGCGKSYLCQALGNAACRKLIGTRYIRLADICNDLNQARISADGSYYRKIDHYKTVRLLIVDDFLTTPITTENAIDLFEIMEAREGRAATLIASQLEPEEWYLRINGELMADSILNRIATAARYIDLDGPNMRKHFASQAREDEKEAKN
jgi:DNA replication protein DnaC